MNWAFWHSLIVDDSATFFKVDDSSTIVGTFDQILSSTYFWQNVDFVQNHMLSSTIKFVVAYSYCLNCKFSLRNRRIVDDRMISSKFFFVIFKSFFFDDFLQFLTIIEIFFVDQQISSIDCKKSHFDDLSTIVVDVGKNKINFYLRMLFFTVKPISI